MNKFTDPRINYLFSTLSPSHAKNINEDAFEDIANVILNFNDCFGHSQVKQVCDASMGHGKSTVIKAFLKWLIKHYPEKPYLLAVKEKQLAADIFKEVSDMYPQSIANVDAENKKKYSGDLNKYQIVIIQHQRLKDLVMGYGSINSYQYYKYSKSTFGKPRLKNIKRQMIIDEKPDFVDSEIYDITNRNNVLDWFEHLAEPLKIVPSQLQKPKSYIAMLMTEQLADNNTDHTTSLITSDDTNSMRYKNLIRILQDMKEHPDNIMKFKSLNRLKHFEKLLTEDNYGRIDDYDFHVAGRKIIVSKLLDYSLFQMNILIFDGTAHANRIQYAKTNFNLQHVENRNDYTRLYLQCDNINTTVYSRSKPDKGVQHTISKRIKQLRETIHKSLIVLPSKSDINTYYELGAIHEDEYYLYIDNKELELKGINILNTTGKNFLKDKTSMYMTNLPKRNADYYKCLAIALFSDKISNLLTNEESDNGNWFRDVYLETVYRFDLYSEILQIIHRTALRIINGKDKIYIHIAYNDDKYTSFLDEDLSKPVLKEINEKFLKGDAEIMQTRQLHNEMAYNRKDKLISYANQIKEKLNNDITATLTPGKVSSSFSNYLKKHWDEQKEMIIDRMKENGIVIFVDENDKRKTKRIKLLN
ncbi:hypothetical protein P4571_07895 [Niallia alba]|uniref:hypothetical protein n=1 Tax=Niallia alba TaxID=2729105 RepID=UPI002E1CFE30|nr:hypothetical protein [Niallia alba]